MPGPRRQSDPVSARIPSRADVSRRARTACRARPPLTDVSRRRHPESVLTVPCRLVPSRLDHDQPPPGQTDVARRASLSLPPPTRHPSSSRSSPRQPEPGRLANPLTALSAPAPTSLVVPRTNHADGPCLDHDQAAPCRRAKPRPPTPATFPCLADMPAHLEPSRTAPTRLARPSPPPTQADVTRQQPRERRET